ncbi:hmg (high mobility group) box domain-containing protein, partial [Cystoisospora suis]
PKEKPRAPPSAYVLFARREQAAVRQQLAAGTGRDRVRVAEFHKALSGKWNRLAAEELQAYKDEAQLLRKKYEQEMTLWGEARLTCHDAEGESVVDPRVSAVNHKRSSWVADELFPQARVNKIIRLDPSLARVTAAAARTMNLAAVLALRHFAGQVDMSRTSRGTLTKDDVASVFRRAGPEMKIFRNILYVLEDGEGGEHLGDEIDDGLQTTRFEAGTEPGGVNSGRLEQQHAHSPYCGYRGHLPRGMRSRKLPQCRPRQAGKKAAQASMQCADISSFFSVGR